MGDEPTEDLTCGQPCDPSLDCEECASYWRRMKQQGYWDRGQWTEKGLREMRK